ncbi:hypothetical protein SDC9_74932 [bioreactor metagenome]|uniref:Uncharacterized protein n=1 Tax=bioreactor metagenome TaxID=1076179 RepID=A0A644YJ55_9ZZZZ
MLLPELPLPVLNAALLLKHIASHLISFQLISTGVFLANLHLHLGALCHCALNVVPARFTLQLQFVNTATQILFFSPKHEKSLQLEAVDGGLHLPKQVTNFFEVGKLFLLSPGQVLMPLIIPDVLLHQLDIGFFRDVADVFRDELLNIHDGAERDRLFHHAADLLVVDVPLGKYICAVLFVAVVKNSVGSRQRLQISPQRRDIHSLLLDDKAVLGNCPVISKKTLLAAAIVPAVKYHADNEPLAFQIVPKLTGDIAGKILPAPGFRVLRVHIGTEISVQRPLGALVGGLIEVSGVQFSQQDNLQGIDDRGFSRTIFPRKKVHVVHLDGLLGKI